MSANRAVLSNAGRAVVVDVGSKAMVAIDVLL
jgi:hypothetical protein